MLSSLGTHLDGLYLSVYCEMPDHLPRILEALREAAQESHDDLYELHDIPGLPGGTWYIRPHGRGKQIRYILENASFWVGICAYNTDKFPRLDFQFKASTLYEYGTNAYPLLVQRFVRYWFGNGAEYRVKVSRADVCVDFQREDFELPERQDVVTRARNRTTHLQYDFVKALTFGQADAGKRKGALEVQLYCKSLELEISDKMWMLDVWKACGDYRADLPVWRAEVRFHRAGLSAFEVDSLEDFIASMGDLLAYAVGDGPGGWLRVCEPESRSAKERGHHTDRRRSADWWSRLREEFLRGAARSGRKRKGYDPVPKIERNIEMAGAHMLSAAAHFRLVSKDDVTRNPHAWGREIGRMYGELLATKRQSWADRLNIAVAELRARAWRGVVTDEDKAYVESIDASPQEMGAEIRSKVQEGLRQQHERNEQEAETIVRSRVRMQGIRADAAQRPTEAPLIPSPSTLRLIDVRPAIGHEAGFYVAPPAARRGDAVDR